MGMKVTITGVGELLAGLNRIGENIQPEMLETITQAAKETQEIMRSEMPNRTGSLQESVQYEVFDNGTEVSASIGPNDANFEGRSVGRATELGLRPGQAFPPADTIAMRYGVLPGIGFLIARAIRDKGTQGLFYAQKTLDEIKSPFVERGIQALIRIVGR